MWKRRGRTEREQVENRKKLDRKTIYSEMENEGKKWSYCEGDIISLEKSCRFWFFLPFTDWIHYFDRSWLANTWDATDWNEEREEWTDRKDGIPIYQFWWRVHEKEEISVHLWRLPWHNTCRTNQIEDQGIQPWSRPLSVSINSSTVPSFRIQ